MKPFSSLFARIVFWFFLNLFLVAVMVLTFFAVQPDVDISALFGKQASDRIRAAARLISHDLQHASVNSWESVLARHGEIYQVGLILFLPDGSQWASRAVTIPDEVTARVRKVFQSRPFRDGWNRQRHGGPMRMHRQRMHRFYEEAFPVQEETVQNKPQAKPIGGASTRLRIRTHDPSRYWVGTRILLFPDPMRPPIKGLLVAVSDSITGNGFFFDPFPWLAAVGAVLLLSVLLWIPLVRSITRPLARMTRATEEIANGRLDVRIQENRADEIGRLGRAVNHMTTRLSGFIKGQKRFLGDVAHELGSPIARIQFGLGILEQNADPANRKRVEDVLEDVNHMSGLVNELLSFSRAEIAQSKPILKEVDLQPIVERVIQREQPAGRDVRVRLEPRTRVVANPELLTRALANVVRNAVKYAGQQGPIIIQSKAAKGRVVIQVRDQGPGVPPENLEQLFEPFFRPDPSRTRDSGGVGLGLAIVKTCVDACEGAVSAQNLTPKGFEITIDVKGSAA